MGLKYLVLMGNTIEMNHLIISDENNNTVEHFLERKMIKHCFKESIQIAFQHQYHKENIQSISVILVNYNVTIEISYLKMMDYIVLKEVDIIDPC